VNDDTDQSHLANIGRLIEELESTWFFFGQVPAFVLTFVFSLTCVGEMRSNLNELYILKTREIVNSIRSASDGPIQTDTHTANLNAAVTDRASRQSILTSSTYNN
jgi:hypothetical protein